MKQPAVTKGRVEEGKDSSDAEEKGGQDEGVESVPFFVPGSQLSPSL